jgi:hypothetical protein
MIEYNLLCLGSNKERNKIIHHVETLSVDGNYNCSYTKSSKPVLKSHVAIYGCSPQIEVYFFLFNHADPKTTWPDGLIGWTMRRNSATGMPVMWQETIFLVSVRKNRQNKLRVPGGTHTQVP